MMPEIKPTLPGQAKLVSFEEDDSSDSYDLSTTGSAFTVAEEALERIGMGNRYVLYIVFAMALAWGLTIMSVMCSAFYETGIHCDPLDDQCHDDRWHMFTIEDEYHIFGGSPLSIEWTASVFFIGDLFGGIILSYLSDIFGRKVIVFPSMLCMDVLGIVSTLAPTYVSFLVIRFFQGFFFTASCVIVWVHASECVSLTRHEALSVIFGVFWVGGYCSVAVIAQFVSDWRDATILVSAPGIVLSLVLWFTVPESFHFLVEKNGRRQLEKFIERAEGKKNALDIDVKSMLVMAHEHDSDSMHSHNFRQFLDFVHANKVYVLYLVASAFIWVINFMLYMGMSMYSTYLGGNAYANYLISGLVELPAYFAGPLLLNRLGRKKTFIIVHMFTAVCLILLAFINHSNRDVFIAVWMFAKFGAAASFMYLFVFGAEVFPTVIRNSCMGICAVCSNLGASIGPHVRHLAYFHPGLPWIVFGALSAISGVLALVLPETHLIGGPREYNKVSTKP